jgi:peptidoglycan hydrolase-like protein with peptidoglycan-binding domain
MAARPAIVARRWSSGVAAVTLAIATSACADSREAGFDDTIPRITSDSTTTIVPPTGAPSTTGAPASTAVPLPLPTQATLPPPSPTQPSAPAQPQTAPLVFQPPTAPPATQPPSPTSTLVVTPGDPANCSSDGIGADTGHLVIADVICRGGWAVGQIDECPQGEVCEGADVFHVTENGWVHDGYFSVLCPESLTESGMPIYTAMAFNPALCGEQPEPTRNILPESTGDRVTQVQIALVAAGYDLNVDGRYGPRTQAAVRDFQARRNLEVDGIAGPRTQEALGIGPGGGPATPASSTSVPAAPTLSTAVTPGQPAQCDAAAISADVGRDIESITGCRGGWAIAPASCPSGADDCVDVFHITDGGWADDGTFPDDCVDDLTVTGMSVHTAAEFAELCADGLPERENVPPDSTGPEVEQVQIALVALGYPIAVDGTYGPRTEAAVRDFQAANDLEVDGIAGPDTQAALGL